ncbi:MAG: hypothetical protein PHQ20_00660 [Candidatus Moranbacteria bacterium]|nr:hypothetical protein [Candidatus Moranbacteria bacterium]
MQILRMRGGREFMVTDAEALGIVRKITQKDIAVIKRLGSLVVGEYDKEYLGPLDDDESLKYDLFADINGILYCFDGKNWLFYHYTGNPFKKEFNADERKPVKEVDVNWEKEKDLKNRKWVRVPEGHEVAVLPIEKYLTIKFTPELKMLDEAKKPTSISLPAVIGSGITMIGTDKRLVREQAVREAEEKKIRTEEKYQANLKKYKKEFPLMSTEKQLEFFLNCCKEHTSYFSREIGFFFDQLSDLAKSVVYRFYSVQEMLEEIERIEEKAKELKKIPINSAIYQIQVGCQYDEPLKRYYASLFPKKVRKIILGDEDDNIF